jgi:hypothetical protein
MAFPLLPEIIEGLIEIEGGEAVGEVVGEDLLDEAEITVPLSSSAIASVTYRPLSGRMTVEMTDGSSWDYHSVPITIFTGLTAAPSPGGFYNRFVRGRFP